MKVSQKLGGIAAFVDAATFAIAIGLFLIFLSPDGYGTGDMTPAETVAYIADHQPIMHIWYLIGYVVFGLFLVVLTLAIHERLKGASPSIVVQSTTAFGIVWAGLVLASGMIANTGFSAVSELYVTNAGQAATVWQALETVIDGIGGGDEIVGGVWVLLISWAALQTGVLPRTLNIIGAVIGVAGIVTVIPGLDDVGAIFGLGLIVWFVWVGTILWRDGAEAAA